MHTQYSCKENIINGCRTLTKYKQNSKKLSGMSITSVLLDIAGVNACRLRGVMYTDVGYSRDRWLLTVSGAGEVTRCNVSGIWISSRSVHMLISPDGDAELG